MKQNIFLIAVALAVTMISIWWHEPSKIPAVFSHQPQRNARTGAAQLVLGKKLAINQANAEDLLSLPGIGAERAASIVRWREQHGPFHQIDELKNVPGVGAKLFRRWSPLIEVNSSY